MNYLILKIEAEESDATPITVTEVPNIAEGLRKYIAEQGQEGGIKKFLQLVEPDGDFEDQDSHDGEYTLDDILEWDDQMIAEMFETMTEGSDYREDMYKMYIINPDFTLTNITELA